MEIDLVMAPILSIVIPCFNLGTYLPEAVASVRAQTFRDFELIIVDDGSDDPQTLAVLADMEEGGARVLRTGNCGVAAARNHGIASASGRYVLPLDADDRIAPDYAERAVALLEEDDRIGIVYGGVQLFGEVNREWELPEFSLPHQLLDNLIYSAGFFRREDWQRAGGYSSDMDLGWEDWDFWLRLLSLGRQVRRLPGITFYYRIRARSRERSLTLVQKARLMARLALRNPRLYLRYLPRLVWIVCAGQRRRPGRIMVLS
ncbi:MAG: glycosyltransferase family 2 protein [Deltaproteobacteria bacterium]|nr:MAG: glycosyltransferase family 2 protein [Deltaproteobacteria bacterium]